MSAQQQALVSAEYLREQSVTIKRLEAENARLRDLLRPIAMQFCQHMTFEHSIGFLRISDRQSWCASCTDRPIITRDHMRRCCAALGIELPTGGTSDEA